MAAERRILHRDWDLYDTRHVVYRPARMDAQTLEEGYRRAYREFYRWRAIWRGAAAKSDLTGRLRHLAYAGGCKKSEPMWDVLIRSGQVLHALPLLEVILSGFGRVGPASYRDPGAADTADQHAQWLATLPVRSKGTRTCEAPSHGSAAADAASK